MAQRPHQHCTPPIPSKVFPHLMNAVTATFISCRHLYSPNTSKLANSPESARKKSKPLRYWKLRLNCFRDNSGYCSMQVDFQRINVKETPYYCSFFTDFLALRPMFYALFSSNIDSVAKINKNLYFNNLKNIRPL